MSKDKNLQAFTLVEISIVLVVIGLLVGGVLAGRSLIRSAGIRSIAIDLNNFKTAIYAFQHKYLFYPGDMPNATAFWGIAGGSNGNDLNCFNAVSVNTATCNGNGNGSIGHSDTHPEIASEWYHGWVHLKNAGLVSGSFTGRRTHDPRRAEIGVNVPASKVGGIGYTYMGGGRVPNNQVGWYSGYYNPMIYVGKQWSLPIGNLETFYPAFSAGESFAIDTKIDDGRPGLGFVRVGNDNPYCVSPTGDANQHTAQYSVDIQQFPEVCNMISTISSPGE